MRKPKSDNLKELNEENFNPMQFFAQMINSTPKIAPPKQPIKKKAKKSKRVQLNKFLGKIICDSDKNSNDIDAKNELRANSQKRFSGVQKLLNLIETSERDRLVNPTNERPKEDSFAKILGKDPSQNPQNLFAAFLGPKKKQKQLKKLNYRFPKIGIPFMKVPVIPMKKRTPPKTLKFSIPVIRPLMNSFYSIKKLKGENSPIVYPPLGHKRDTLDKIRTGFYLKRQMKMA